MRPHPMMAPELKMERMIDALCDPEVSVVLIDMVIGSEGLLGVENAFVRRHAP